MQFETILPFLRPIEHLILDPDISGIMVMPILEYLSRNTFSFCLFPPSPSPNRSSPQQSKTLLAAWETISLRQSPFWTPAYRMGAEWQRSFLHAVLMALRSQFGNSIRSTSARRETSG